jgi:hypothetical protein
VVQPRSVGAAQLPQVMIATHFGVGKGPESGGIAGLSWLLLHASDFSSPLSEVLLSIVRS